MVSFPKIDDEELASNTITLLLLVPVSGRIYVNRFGHLKVNIRTCKSEQKSEHFSCVRTARSVAIKGRRPSALRAFTPPLAAVEARGAGEPGPFELRLCGPFPCRKVVAA